MRDLVAENAVSRAAFDQAWRCCRPQSRRSRRCVRTSTSREPAQLYASFCRRRRRGHRTHGPEPGEVVSASRMVVQVAREGAATASLRLPAQVKDSAPRQSSISVALRAAMPTSRQRARCGKLHLEPTRSRHLRRARAAYRPAAGNASRQHGDRAASSSTPPGHTRFQRRLGTRRGQHGGVGRRCTGRHGLAVVTSRAELQRDDGAGGVRAQPRDVVVYRRRAGAASGQKVRLLETTPS